MRCDRFRRILVVVAGLLILPADPLSEQQIPQTRSAWLGDLHGSVTLKSSGAEEATPARPNTPIQEGMELSTSSGSWASVEFKDGSAILLMDLAQATFTELSQDARGVQQLTLTLEQGHASVAL